MTADHPYEMTLSLSVLKQLGLNLYSNVPAVLAEVVANSWDADAENVLIEVDRSTDSVVILDDGRGMTKSDINQKYLYVGHERREAPDESITPKYKRDVMGRMGIGKLRY